MVSRLHKKYLYASLAFIWLSSLGISIPYCLRLGLIEGACIDYNETYISTESFLIFIGISRLYIWCVPYFIMTVTYCLIARALKTNSLKHDNSRAMELRNKQNAKIVKMFVIVIITFLVLTMPHAIFFFYDCYMIVYGKNYVLESGLRFTLLYMLYILSTGNGCVNPIIYAKMHRDMNRYISDVMHRIVRISCQLCCVTSRNISAPSRTRSVATSKADQSNV